MAKITDDPKVQDAIMTAVTKAVASHEKANLAARREHIKLVKENFKKHTEDAKVIGNKDAAIRIKNAGADAVAILSKAD